MCNEEPTLINISTPLVFLQVEFFVPLKQNCRIMKDKITWEDANLFDYINEIEFMYVPAMDDYKYYLNLEISGLLIGEKGCLLR